MNDHESASLVFLQGCKFRCLYCHNPDTQPLDGWKMYSIDEIVEMAERVRPYFGKRWGVTISWWEPLLQSKELIPLFQELKKRWIHAVIDTNGHPWDRSVQELVRDYTDLVLLDIKEINPERHEKLVLVPNDNTLRFASWLREIKPTWIRYVLVPGYSDFEEDLEEFGRRMGEYENIECVDILPYHTLGTYKYKRTRNPLWTRLSRAAHEWRSPEGEKYPWKIFQKGCCEIGLCHFNYIIYFNLSFYVKICSCWGFQSSRTPIRRACSSAFRTRPYQYKKSPTTRSFRCRWDGDLVGPKGSIEKFRSSVLYVQILRSRFSLPIHSNSESQQISVFLVTLTLLRLVSSLDQLVSSSW